MNSKERDRFDALLEEVLENLPQQLHVLLEQVPLIVDDRPTPKMLKDLGMEPDELLCGLHSGFGLTERSVEQSGEAPNDIRIFREGIVDLAGGWEQDDADDRVYDEIWITVLHEIGHEFGLSEDDLADLGYE